ncbi:fungal transcriptional regulatory protein [Purpureocillium lavendulum]|uniref:Fungal transcriptional regulatory protein n=1 Tax=Purpureocillium lavendulum TaxID=1247861 RepID=A0AB34FW71_9HYPO|nr:fungal transcriptional regulatory protein [Purpureocillium lavendulum]
MTLLSQALVFAELLVDAPLRVLDLSSHGLALNGQPADVASQARQLALEPRPLLLVAGHGMECKKRGMGGKLLPAGATLLVDAAPDVVDLGPELAVLLKQVREAVGHSDHLHVEVVGDPLDGSQLRVGSVDGGTKLPHAPRLAVLASLLEAGEVLGEGPVEGKLLLVLRLDGLEALPGVVVGASRVGELHLELEERLEEGVVVAAIAPRHDGRSVDDDEEVVPLALPLLLLALQLGEFLPHALDAGFDSENAMKAAAARRHGSKGCSTCTKRRIRCDLTQPTCKKCEKKGLTCPGYGPRLRWAGGVAVRGKLKGQNVPLPGLVAGRSPEPDSDETEASSARRGSAPASGSGSGPGPGSASATSRASASRSSVPSTAPNSNSNTTTTTTTSDAVIVSPASLDNTLRKSAREFIEYYDKNIAGLMVWFDSENNDYRSRVLPRAANTPGLRLAVAAISAHHGGLTFDHETPRFSEAARDACLNLIQEHVRDMTGRLTGGSELTSQSDIADAEWMLAAILMISTYEMANAQTGAAESHRMAARTIANVFGHNAQCCTRVFDFLRNQLAVLDVMSTSTSFDLADVENTVLPPPSMANGLFVQYLTLVHQVTLVSRRRMYAVGDAATLAAELTPSAIRSRFEQARGTTLLAAGRLEMQPSAVGRDFIRLVDIYHHAGVIYAYRCLGLVALEHIDREASMVKLFEQFAALEDATLCAQNLPWPAFVAGTECHGDPLRQDTIATLFETITEATGFTHFRDVLKFLRIFWASEHTDWQPLGRDLQQNGFRILPLWGEKPRRLATSGGISRYEFSSWRSVPLQRNTPTVSRASSLHVADENGGVAHVELRRDRLVVLGAPVRPPLVALGDDNGRAVLPRRLGQGRDAAQHDGKVAVAGVVVGVVAVQRLLLAAGLDAEADDAGDLRLADDGPPLLALPRELSSALAVSMKRGLTTCSAVASEYRSTPCARLVVVGKKPESSTRSLSKLGLRSARMRRQRSCEARLRTTTAPSRSSRDKSSSGVVEASRASRRVSEVPASVGNSIMMPTIQYGAYAAMRYNVGRCVVLAAARRPRESRRKPCFGHPILVEALATVPRWGLAAAASKWTELTTV